MKQTNNAIKFLMAQYRAIFKNANIAMVAAIAASALAAGQAQAAVKNFDNTTLPTITDTDVTIDGTGTDAKKYLKLELTDGAASDKAFVITVASGGAANKIKGSVDLANSTIKVAGTAKADAKLDIGTGAQNPTNLTLKELAVAEQGTLIVAGTSESNTTSVTASNISFGSGKAPVNVDVNINAHATVTAAGEGAGKITINQANVTVADKGALKGNLITLTDGTVSNAGTLSGGTIDIAAGTLTNTGTLTAGTLNLAGGELVATKAVTANDLTVSKGTLTATEAVTAANELNITGGKVDATKAVSGLKVNLTDGTVNFAAATGVLGSDTSTVKINGGTVTSTQAGAIKGSSITIDKGTFTLTEGLTIGSVEGSVVVNSGTFTVPAKKTLAFKGTTNLNSGTAITTTADGKLSFTGNATIADDAKLTLGDTSVTVIASDAALDEKTATLNVSTKKFGDLTKAAGNKIEASGAAGTVAELHFTDSGAAIDLAKVGALNGNGGVNDENITHGANVTLKLSADAIDFNKTKIESERLRLAANTLTVGDGKAAFTVSGGATDTLLEVGKTLTVSGGKDLTIKQGAISLHGDTGSKDNSVDAGKITVGGGQKGTLSVAAGEWTVKSLEIASGSVNVITDAVLKITGDLTTKDKDNQLVAQNTATIDASKAVTIKLLASGTKLEDSSTLILDKADVFNASGDSTGAFADNAVVGSANSTINIMDGDKLATISREKFEAFTKKAAFDGLWGVTVDGLVPEGTTEMNIGGADNNLIAGLGTGYENVQAKVDGTKPIDKNYSAGSVVLSSGDSLAIGTGSMTLQNANAHDNDGMFVSKPGAKPEDKATVAGVNFGTGSTAYSSLTLQGSGTIGAITADAAGSGSVTFGAGEGKTGDVTVEGAIGADTKEIGKLVTNGSNVTVASGDVFVQSIDFNGGSFTVSADKKLVLGAGAGDFASTIDGNLTAGELTFKANTTGSVDIASNAVVDLGTLTGATGIKINVGKDGVENGSATLLADKLVLKKATLKIDPAYDQPYASAIAKDLSGASGDTLDGHVNVGHNALFAVGFDTKAEVDAVLGSLINAGHFTDPNPADPAPGTRSSVTAPNTDAVVAPNAVVLNKGIKFDANGGIYVGTGSTVAASNTLQVDAGSALVVTDKVFTVDPATGKKTGVAITGNGGNATATIAQGANLVLVGAFNGADNELEILSGFTDPTTALKNFTVSVGGSNLLEGTWTSAGKLDVNLTQDEAKLAAAFAGASTPVKQFMLDMLDGTKFAFSTEAGYQLINQLAMANNGVAADAAAHAATYAGAQQAAVASVTTMADAMFGRVGAVGVEAASIAATGSQANGGVWLTPMYKSVDSEGFNAEGASYGSDVDLSGVAFGADTVNGNMRFGAVFNIGSGDAEGKGNGNGLKDEFDYYGFGIYSAMGFGNFALVGDASMTVISHEVEGLGLKGKADTTAVTMGVTGQYTVATPAVDVAPHLGARFIRLNTDSYDLTSANGVVGTTDFDVQNVFSVPLGVTLSKAFVAGGWSLAPSADLTIAFNTGDTDAKSTTRFTGINKNLDLTAEVLDEVQYGLTVGLGAQYGAFGTSFGINYTGSENTDAFGVNAQCRYMF